MPLFLVDQKKHRYIDCRDIALPYGERLVSDVVYRTETALPRRHCCLLQAQKQAQRLNLNV